MGKGSEKRRTSAKDAKRQASRKGSHHREGAGVNQFAEVRRASWRKPPVERLHDKLAIDDLELWAARRYAAGYMAFINPVTSRGGMVLDRVDGGHKPAGDSMVDQVTIADDYRTVASALDANDVAQGRVRGFTREIVTAVCVVDMPLSVIEERWHMGHGTVLGHLKRGLAIYAALIERPDRAPREAPVAYGLSTSMG